MMLFWYPKDVFYYLLFLYLLQFVVCFVELPLLGPRPILIYQSYLSIHLPTLYQCLELCVAYKLCRNLYFVKRSGECVLNSEDNDRQYIWRAGYYHMAMSRKAITQGIGGACSAHTCAIDEICIQSGQAFFCVKHGYSTVKCPVKWGRMGDLCFTVTTGNKTWTEAKDYCASTGAELLTFDSSDEYSRHKEWIIFQLHSMIKLNITSGMVWTGLKYEPPMPSWMNVEPPETKEHNLCIGVRYNKTGGNTRIENLEAVSLNERNGVACQHMNPDQWP